MLARQRGRASRHGTTTLFAALNVLDGTVIGRSMQRHRHQEFIRFLNAIDADLPAGKVVHVILGNHTVHKHPKVGAWTNRHERLPAIRKERHDLEAAQSESTCRPQVLRMAQNRWSVICTTSHSFFALMINPVFLNTLIICVFSDRTSAISSLILHS